MGARIQRPPTKSSAALSPPAVPFLSDVDIFVPFPPHVCVCHLFHSISAFFSTGEQTGKRPSSRQKKPLPIFRSQRQLSLRHLRQSQVPLYAQLERFTGVFPPLTSFLTCKFSLRNQREPGLEPADGDHRLFGARNVLLTSVLLLMINDFFTTFKQKWLPTLWPRPPCGLRRPQSEQMHTGRMCARESSSWNRRKRLAAFCQSVAVAF